MRSIAEQLPLFLPTVAHPYAEVLRSISSFLCQLGEEALELVYGDLIAGLKKPGRGRPGMSASQVLRACVLLRMHGWDYEDLSFHLADSVACRRFCGFFDEGYPAESTLHENIDKLSSSTFEAINVLLVRAAADIDLEDLRTIRSDCFVVEANVHSPTDSSLLWDCARVLYRLLGRARLLVGTRFRDATRYAKRLWCRIENSRGKPRKQPHYRKLVRVIQRAMWTSERACRDLRMVPEPRSLSLEAQLVDYTELASRVVEQTRRRVFLDDPVSASEKVVSIFEPHTDIIIKDHRGIYIGHKVCISAGRNLVTDALLFKGNPADAKQPPDLIARHEARYGLPPLEFTADGGFASRENVRILKENGVDEVAFSKTRGVAVEEMVSSEKIYKRLFKFRAGVEAVISFLKRGVALRRCPLRGWDGFAKYLSSCVLAANLLTLGRRVTSAAA